MITVTSQTLGECWQQCVASVVTHGKKTYDEDVFIYEILGLSIEITHPSSEDSFINDIGDQKVIEKMMMKFTKGVVMDDRPFTYGQLIYDMNGIDQFEWMLARLKNKPETKSATISLLTPGLTHPNLPCLSTLDAKIRDGKLHLQFFFRSQNVFGRQYANLLALAKLHEQLSIRSGCHVGCLRGYIASAHIYDYDLNEAQMLSRSQSINVHDRYYTHGPSSVRT